MGGGAQGGYQPRNNMQGGNGGGVRPQGGIR